MATKTKKLIAVIGTGISGLASAYFLLEKGYDVTLFEKEKGSGGLAGSTEVNGVPIERFYHHFFASDKDLLTMSQEIGVRDKIHFYQSSIGMYDNGTLYPFTTPLDLLKYPLVPMIDRIKMGLLSVYLIKRSNWYGLEELTVKKLFQKIRAPKLYTKIWKPLLQLKYGKFADQIPATFLWGRINPRGRSRKGAGEQLGYFDGGYKTFFDALEKVVAQKGAHFQYATISTIQRKKNRSNTQKPTVTIKAGKQSWTFDAVIFTGSNTLLMNMYKDMPSNVLDKMRKIKYQAINCMIIETKKSVSPYYWLNALDKKISFIGCIEHTNLVPQEMYGRTVLYVFNYLSVDDPIYTMPEKEVYDMYTRDLKKIFPHFNKKDVITWQLARNPYATPIYKGTYSKIMPPTHLSEGIYLANTSQVYPEDRNVNNGIVLARKVVQELVQEI